MKFKTIICNFKSKFSFDSNHYDLVTSRIGNVENDAKMIKESSEA